MEKVSQRANDSCAECAEESADKQTQREHVCAEDTQKEEEEVNYSASEDRDNEGINYIEKKKRFRSCVR